MQNYEALYRIFSQELDSKIKRLNERTPSNLYEPLVYTLKMGGKRIRPVLLLMAYELFDPNINKALPLATAIEMFHNFTLLHDDFMDDAGLRRNMPTVHMKYSNNVAILSGDAMSILSFEYLNNCDCDKFRPIFSLFTQTALEICEGQQFDMDFETRNDVSVDEYLEMIRLKTAVLLASSLKIGALAANAPDRDANRLYEFGYNLGMAFQLQDDYLDSFGSTESFGKNIGGDIVSNKKTFLMLKALELASETQREELFHLMTDSSIDRDKKIEKVIALFKSTGVPSILKSKMDEFYSEAIIKLDAVDVENQKKEVLKGIAKKMMKREN